MSRTLSNWNCETLREHLDLYMDHHLPAEAGAQAQSHLDECTACAAEWVVRCQLRGRLRSVVRSGEAPPFLKARIRANLRTAQHPDWWRLAWVPALAAVLVCLGGTIAYQRGALRLTRASQDSYIASVSRQLPALLRVGLGDHIHCTVFRKLPKNAPTLEELTRKMGPEYAGLIPIVRKHTPGAFQLVLAHQCRYRGRRFVHLSLKDGSRRISLVIARKEDGESFEAQKLAPELVRSNLPMYQGHVQRFSLTAFETSHHLVYLVSDLSRENNENLMLAMAPEVHDFLSSL